ncbi:MAG TPA: Uma2 family endonuclease [Vicinamibacteria bacterium]|nr:Uma2 family endonuclease [Vicinamibacteria bacterium]
MLNCRPRYRSLSRRLFTTEEFRNMLDAGVFQEDDRLELVDGEIVEMSPIGHRHAACVRKLNFLLRSVGARALVDVQNPLGISKDNDSYPEVVLLRPRADNYAGKIQIRMTRFW